jgi:glucokinase
VKIFAADIGGTSTKICIADEKGTIHDFTEYETEYQKGGPFIVEQLIKKVATYHDIDAIGISTAGQVNSIEGSIIYANENMPNYTGTKWKGILENTFQIPVKVENDVNAAALGEMYFGAANSFSDFLCLTYGTGIGGAIMMNSTIYKGFNGVAAEFGHIITHPEGEECNCGQKGCYERYASTTAFVKKVKKIDDLCNNGRDIFEKMKQRSVELEKVLNDWVYEIALGLASLIHIFNPPAIIIGGGIMEQERLVPMISDKVRGYIMDSFSEVEIIKASLGNKAGLLGAVSLHLEKDY